MRPLIIGSAASSIFNRAPIDIDIICKWDDYVNIAKSLKPLGYKSSVIGPEKFALSADPTDIIFECEIAWADTSALALLEYAAGHCEHSYSFLDKYPIRGLRHIEWAIANIDILYTLKMSHRYLKNSPHFAKTMADIHTLRAAGAKIFDEAWLVAREAETYDYRHPKLNRFKEEFFTDDVTYIYDHDSVHRVVAVTEGVPAYTQYMADGAQVMWSKKKFFELPEEVRIAGVYEEAAVLALERAIVPYGVPEGVAFPMALKKVCTSITSGTFREYAWEHYDEAMAMWQSQQRRGPLFDRVKDSILPIDTLS
jgi:hypothetical protein